MCTEGLHGLVNQKHVARHNDPVPALGVLLCISQPRVLVQHLDVWIDLQEQRHDLEPRGMWSVDVLELGLLMALVAGVVEKDDLGGAMEEKTEAV